MRKQSGPAPETRERVLIGTSLLPYIDDLIPTSLYGNTVEEVVNTLVRRQIQELISQGEIRKRKFGRKVP